MSDNVSTDVLKRDADACPVRRIPAAEIESAAEGRSIYVFDVVDVSDISACETDLAA